MISATDETRILEQLRSGDRDAAMRELFESVRGPLFGLALRMTGRPDLADDAVQETFVDLIRSLDGFRGDARLTTWLFRVAIRAATRVASRASGRTETLPEELDVPDRDGPDHGGAATTVEQRDSAARILAAIADLPAPLRAVFALSALREVPQTEIAVILGLPEGTVHSRMSKARARLREVLERAR